MAASTKTILLRTANLVAIFVVLGFGEMEVERQREVPEGSLPVPKTAEREEAARPPAADGVLQEIMEFDRLLRIAK